MHRVYGSPSFQIHNTYRSPPGGNEEQHMRAVGIAFKRYLQETGKVAVRLSRRAWRTMPDPTYVTKVVADANAWRPHAHICIHSNAAAASADGTITYYLSGSVAGERLARSVQARVGAVSPGTDYGIRPQTGWGELYVRAPVAYCEIGFHTNKIEAQDIADYHELYGFALARAVAAYLGVTLKRNKPLTGAERKRLRYRLVRATPASLRWLRRLVDRLLEK